MTVGREHPTCPAMSVLDSPSAASSRILARSARAARIEPERLHWPRVRRSSGDIASGGALAGMSNRAATTPQPSSKFRDDLLGDQMSEEGRPVTRYRGAPAGWCQRQGREGSPLARWARWPVLGGLDVHSEEHEGQHPLRSQYRRGWPPRHIGPGEPSEFWGGGCNGAQGVDAWGVLRLGSAA